MTTLTDNEKGTASFVFYYSFADMISKIPDREIRLQAYEMLFDYAMFGIEPQTENWVVDMVFSAIKPQIDANNRRRKNGKKGGRKPAQEAVAIQPVQEIAAEPKAAEVQAQSAVQAQTEAQTEAQAEVAAQAVQAEPAMQPQQAVPVQSAVQTVQAEAPMQAEPVMQAETAVQIAPAVQLQPAIQAEAVTVPNMQTAKEDDLLGPSDRIVYFGENKYPTTPRELGHFEKFAYKLFQQYGGDKPNLADIERVVERTYTRMERLGGEVIAVFDRDKADLLDYAFEQAKKADKLNWRYIDGMYHKITASSVWRNEIVV